MVVTSQWTATSSRTRASSRNTQSASHPHTPHTLTPSQVFACSDAEDYERPFRESEMNKLIEVHVNSSLFYVTIPPPPQRRQGQIPIHWFTHTLVLPYSDSHTLVLPYSDSHTLVPIPIRWFPHTPILPFSHSQEL